MRRPLFFCGASFLAAATACFYLGYPATLSLAALVAAGGFWFIKTRRRTVAALLLSALLAVAISAGHMAFRVLPVARMAGQGCDAVLTVTDLADYGGRFAGEGIADLTLPDGTVRKDVKISFTGYGEALPAVGKSIAFSGELLPAATQDNTVQRRLSEGRYIALRLPGSHQTLDRSSHPAQAALARFRQQVTDTVYRTVGGDTGALLSAMLTGDTHLLSDTARGWLRDSGLSHLTAVSGLHITLSAGAPMLLLRGKRRKIGLGVGLLLALGYTALAGFSPSALRALTMLFMVTAAELFSRRADGLTSLSVAGVLIVAANPMAVAGIGFQLSFLATLGILTLSGRMQTALEDAATVRFGKVGALGLPIASLSVSVGALLFTAPLSALVFGYLPVLGLLANLMVTALLPLVLLFAAIAAAAGLCLPAIASLAAVPARLLGGYVLGTARLVSGQPFAVLPVRECYQVVLLLGLGLLIVAAFRLKPGRRAVAALACCCVMAAGTTFLGHKLVRGGGYEVLRFDDTDATVLVRGREAVVLDLPASTYEADRVADALGRLGVRRVVLATGESDQTVRLLADRLPVDFCRTGTGLHPIGVNEVLSPGEWTLSAMKMQLHIAGDGAVTLPGENLLPDSQKYAILKSNATDNAPVRLMSPAPGAERYWVGK